MASASARGLETGRGVNLLCEQTRTHRDATTTPTTTSPQMADAVKDAKLAYRVVKTLVWTWKHSGILVLAATGVAVASSTTFMQQREGRAAVSDATNPVLVVMLASKAGPKLIALQRALRRCVELVSPVLACEAGGAASKFRIVAHPAASGIAEQPFGYEETRQGALNRLAAAKAAAITSGSAFVVAIENGLVQHDAMWVDFAWVVIEDLSSGEQASSISTGLHFPTKPCAEAQQIGFATMTGGAQLARETGCAIYCLLTHASHHTLHCNA